MSASQLTEGGWQVTPPSRTSLSLMVCIQRVLMPYFCARGVGVLTMSSSVLGSNVAVVSISTALLPAMIGYIFGESN